MLKKSLFLATAIILGTFCTTQAANSAVAKFVKTEISCPSGITCAVRIALPTNRLITLKAISCVDVSANVTSTDIRIAKGSVIYFEGGLFRYDINTYGVVAAPTIFHYQNILIDTKLHEVWLNLKSTVPGQLAATCYAAF